MTQTLTSVANKALSLLLLTSARLQRKSMKTTLRSMMSIESTLQSGEAGVPAAIIASVHLTHTTHLADNLFTSWS